jgi:hypothetical protein
VPEILRFLSVSRVAVLLFAITESQGIFAGIESGTHLYITIDTKE